MCCFKKYIQKVHKKMGRKGAVRIHEGEVNWGTSRRDVGLNFNRFASHGYYMDCVPS